MGALGARESPKLCKSPGAETGVMFFREYMELAFPDEATNHAMPMQQLLDRMRMCLWIPSVFDDGVKGVWALMELYGPDVMEMDAVSGCDGELGVEDEYVLGQSMTLRFFLRTWVSLDRCRAQQ